MDQPAGNIIQGNRLPRITPLLPRDTEILRGLAERVSKWLHSDLAEQRRCSWTAHNQLQGEMPLILCDPENGWNEIIPSSLLETDGPLARIWEMHLRKQLYWFEEMGDDYTADAFFDVPHVYQESDWGVPFGLEDPGDDGAYRWIPGLPDFGNMDDLHPPQLIIDDDASDALLSEAQRVFGNVLPVRLRTSWWWSLGMTQTLAQLRGLEQIMIDMCYHPDETKALMEFICQATMTRLDELESRRLLSANNDGSYVGSGGLGYSNQLARNDPVGTVKLEGMWGFCESQETGGISPEMFQEFIQPYQMRILKRFGLNCYGCCEPMHLRWRIVRQFPNLRRVSVSPWSDVAKMAEALGTEYIMSLKPHPAPLARPMLDEVEVRQELTTKLQASQGCKMELIMKDNHTLGGNRDNARAWCRIAREIIAKFWD